MPVPNAVLPTNAEPPVVTRRVSHEIPSALAVGWHAHIAHPNAHTNTHTCDLNAFLDHASNTPNQWFPSCSVQALDRVRWRRCWWYRHSGSSTDPVVNEFCETNPGHKPPRTAWPLPAAAETALPKVGDCWPGRNASARAIRRLGTRPGALRF